MHEIQRQSMGDEQGDLRNDYQTCIERLGLNDQIHRVEFVLAVCILKSHVELYHFPLLVQGQSAYHLHK